MSTRQEREAEDSYERDNDASPVSGDVQDNSYVFDNRGDYGNQAPVQPDQAGYDDPMQPPYSNTDQQLGMLSLLPAPQGVELIDTADDEREAIDSSNILKGDRLRHAKPQTRNKYDEGADEGDLPNDIRDGLVGVSGTKRVT